LRYLITPWLWRYWKKGPHIVQLENSFKRDYPGSTALAVDSGRSALRLVLEGLNLKPGDEVVTQAFTCIVVPNAIRAAGGTPRFLDIDSTYNLSPEILKATLSKNHRITAVIVQHTFGVPADILSIQKICQDHSITLIEDCAHSLGVSVNSQPIGSFGDAAIFSFGRDKVISSVSGGMAIAFRKDLQKHLSNLEPKLPLPSLFWIKQRLLHPVIFSVAKRLYYVVNVGKVIIAVGRKLRLLPDVLSTQEKAGQAPAQVYRLPNAIAHLAIQQYQQLPKNLEHRHSIAKMYRANIKHPSQQIPPNSKPLYLRYSIEVKNQTELLKKGRLQGILLGDWYTDIVIPCSANHSDIGYIDGSCPAAERLATRIVNLPTNPLTSPTAAQQVINFINQAAS